MLGKLTLFKIYYVIIYPYTMNLYSLLLYFSTFREKFYIQEPVTYLDINCDLFSNIN